MIGPMVNSPKTAAPANGQSGHEVAALVDNIPTRRMFGIPILAATMDQVLEICEAAVRR